jgi:non-homologous end joining protein Ku
VYTQITFVPRKLSSEEFEPQSYEDEYQARVLAMIENKIKGREITIPPTLARGHVIDLMTALKESFKTIERGKERADQKKRRKA